MAIFRLLNEFGRESVVLALEPARQCVCKCTYCFAELNSRAQSAGAKKSFEDTGTFESIVERAFGPDYDPTNFRQWAVKNNLPVGYANTVEPFQDIPQARGILQTARRIGMPLFIQTKGHNFHEVWDDLKPLADNTVLFLSFPTPNERAIKRFEPGTPTAAERIKVIEKAVDAGFYVTLALAPYHEDWCDDPAGFIKDAARWGVQQVFFDPLHMNRRQRAVATDRVMVEMAYDGKYSPKRLNHLMAIYAAAMENGLEFDCPSGHPIVHGAYPTVPSLCPPGVFSQSTPWNYHDGHLFRKLEDLYPDENVGPYLVPWSAVLASMEDDGAIDQEFSMSSLRDLMAFKELPPTWKGIIGKQAKMPEYFRALWNEPNKNQFAWRHPFMRIAMTPAGTPHLDDDGNLIGVYYPDGGNSLNCVIDNIDDHEYLSYDRE